MSARPSHIFALASDQRLFPARRRLAAALGLGTLVAATWLTLPPARAQAPAAGPEVPVLALGERAVGAGLQIDGSLQAVRQTVLSAQASGRIASLSVKAGDRVKAGQVLAVIDDRATQAGVAQAQAGVAQAEANLANARAAFERTQALRAQGFVAQAALDGAQAQFRAAEAGAAAARAGQTQASVAQGFTRLTAPYDGWVLATHAEAGSLAMPGSPVLTVYAPQPIRAVVFVPASQQSLASQAQRVEVRLPDGRWVQPVARTALPAADPVSQTVEWRLDLSAADGANQVPGRQVQVRFVGGEAQRLVVPASALLRRGELTAVYVATPRADGAQGFGLRAVRTGASHGEAGVEVLSGLKAGDRVALDPVRAGIAGARPAAQ
ncbi:MAG TPA: efflux RND transporter periplasmic adaptor subunit [Hydrogenophaga sp.]|uniref:efflux RND transporter periplasmic adaptor subunit n=1 Tax=Hydrogenophaga sp. TaxID=1904254 RepID=UPI002B7C04FA|nr:efflux RND transporter periplasmic adaptor subunit [Hydrogenophaga sp.]HMN93075.1 efflux RND transporter periplasmic adaptor subunit [Hydrogenophaga sp.]HMP09794.1 efflux RND transporter periplasmic adaptor subunit [Hydrogenophaga sp.]